jgi:carboxymethylenebutenolidase
LAARLSYRVPTRRNCLTLSKKRAHTQKQDYKSEEDNLSRRKVFLARRALLICVGTYLQFGLCPYAAIADDIGKQDFTVMTAERPVAVRRYAAAGNDLRPAVLILHGRSGPAPKPRFAAAYDRYATALANVGIDAYLVSYFSESDGKAMLSDDEALRAAVRAQRYPAWIDAIRGIANAVARRPEASGRVGLLGFSLGGNLAAATAASDPSIAALVVFYGGIPDTVTGRVLHLPPTLELHGDADEEAGGKALIETAQALGAPAEQVVYPGARHGFDFDPARSDSKDAQARATEFLQRHLK